MDESNSLVNLGDLAKPATVLIEKISDAIGGIFKPYQIRRVAQAEADAEKIEAATKIEVTELQRRAMARFFAEEAKKQSNIEAITGRYFLRSRSTRSRRTWKTIGLPISSISPA